MQTILLAKVDRFGDAVLALDFVRSVIAAGHRLVWVGGPSAPVALQLLNLPRDRVEFFISTLDVTEPGSGDFSDFERLVEFLNGRKFDVAICGSFNGSWLDESLVRLAHADRRVILRRPDLPFAIPPVLLPHFRDCPPSEFTGIPDFFAESAAFNRLLSLALIRIAAAPAREPRPPVTRLLIAPGKRDPSRTWAAENFAQLAVTLRAARRFEQMTIISGPFDRAACESLNQALARIDQPTLPIANLPSDDIEPARRTLVPGTLLLSHDTGWMHLAAELDIPGVAIFSAAQPGRFGPRSGRHTVIRAEIPCAGCNWSCCFDSMRCVSEIPVSLVVEAVLARAEDPMAVSADVRHPVDDPSIPARMSAHLRRMTADRNAHVWECERLRWDLKKKRARISKLTLGKHAERHSA